MQLPRRGLCSRRLALVRGSSIVEFAVIAPAVVLVLFGFLEIVRGVWLYNTVTYAAREGGRYAMVHGSKSSAPASTTDVATAVKAAAASLDPTKVQVTTTWTPDKAPGSTVDVKVDYAWQPLAMLASLGTRTLSASTRRVILH